jgi:hypothetical protein
MQINLWFNDAMGQWRWTLTDPETMDMESGQREDLREEPLRATDKWQTVQLSQR